MTQLATIAEILWGNRARLSYLLFAAALLFFTLLGAREIWTQEHRWADIVAGMFYRNDFFHPYLEQVTYYDKPLLSYWLIALSAKLSGELTSFALRLPSALAGLLAIYAIYRLGTKLKDQQLGMLAGWLLLTTFYFLFWARTSSADMLNLAGSLFAVSWYFDHREKGGFFSYSIFFLIIALTCLCKGLVGAMVPFIAVAIAIYLQKSWRQYLRWPVWLALIPAVAIYLLPFWLSSYLNGESYGQNGLYLVYRENILRYFQPFDHQGPIYTYFIYLPIYLLPWVIFFVPALFALKSRWQTLSLSSKWLSCTLLMLFLFFTFSGSRRSYYVLPLVPFAILFTADWLLSSTVMSKRYRSSAGLVILAFLVLFITVDILPAWYYSRYGVKQFAVSLQQAANKIQPWNKWHVVLLDSESKLNFYLQLAPTTQDYHIAGSTRTQQTKQTLLQRWPVLTNKPANTIFITRKSYVPLIKDFFVGYRLVEVPVQSSLPFLKKHDVNVPVAYLPEK